MRKAYLILLIVATSFTSLAQQENCLLQPPVFTIHFGTGQGSDLNTMVSSRYRRISGYCPSDGHFAITPNTYDCFRGDWFSLPEDHTAGDRDGNMLLVNSSPRSGMFFNTAIKGLKGNTNYELGVWMMNVCRITEKCPFPLLPDITIQIMTAEGENVAQLNAGEIFRVHSPQWKQHQFFFTTPASAGNLILMMTNNSPGGCGNDFVMDDITFRECIVPPPAVVRKKPTPAVKKSSTGSKPSPPKIKQTASKPSPPKTSQTTAKNITKPLRPKPVIRTTKKPANKAASPTAKKPAGLSKTNDVQPTQKVSQDLTLAKPAPDTLQIAPPPVKRAPAFPPPPEVLRNRTNALLKKIVAEPGDIRVDLYDNGEIDGDTVSIYHNNRLIVSHTRLSQRPITFRIKVNASQPHHELVMVADNLGSIPPNTSLMIVTNGEQRHEVFISSTKQKNAKVVIDLGVSQIPL